MIRPLSSCQVIHRKIQLGLLKMLSHFGHFSLLYVLRSTWAGCSDMTQMVECLYKTVLFRRVSTDILDGIVLIKPYSAIFISASSLFFGQISSCLVSGYFIERIGLRRSMIISSVVFSIGLVGQALSSSVILICVSRAILGETTDHFRGHVIR